MKNSFNDISELADEIIDKSSNRNLLIFANNSVGKTSLSKCITDLKEPNEIFCYNAFVEESFSWVNDFENEEYYLTINNDSFINEAVITNGLENRINEVFRSLIDSKIDSNFEIADNKIQKVYFSLTTGDESSVENIKLSKGEESLFIWSIFCTIIEMALDEKIDETNYEDLNYIIIDDPVTSLEEERIVSIALYIKEFVMNKIAQIRKNNKKIGLLITTHNRLLYNVIFNELKKEENCYRLYKKSNAYELKRQNESPFGYHIEEIKTIYNCVNENSINKIHFNMFRNVLEKTASFIGYSTDWSRCLSEGLEDRPKMIRLLNLYSHSRLFDLDDKELSSDEKELFKKFFLQFLEDYKWSGYNEE